MTGRRREVVCRNGSADRVDVRVAAHDRHLSSRARLTGDAHDNDDALLYLRNLKLKQTLDKPRRGHQRKTLISENARVSVQGLSWST